MNRKSKGGLKEMFRKTIVSLKRKPQTIPMLVLAVAFLYYSLNLTHVSDTTAKIQSQGMGLSGFCTMLFSMLSFVCFINAYPHRKKTNIPMLVLMLLMVAGLIFCDTYYMGRITAAITRDASPIDTVANPYILQAFQMLNVHRIILLVGGVLTLLVPVLRKLLRKIDTSLPMEEGSQMESLHLSQED